jgi:hypothetical protein
MNARTLIASAGWQTRGCQLNLSALGVTYTLAHLVAKNKMPVVW